MSPPDAAKARAADPGPATQKTAAASTQHDRSQRTSPASPPRWLAAPLDYGRDDPDTDQWCDRDGTVYRGRGLFERRPLRWLRRKVAHWWARWWR
ncbi:hypothetical protein [Pseudonocardia sp.]|uniref:hypothetical protein n=1 Tax=Pseudonocardia sp. TaxID=60912 RepID=UPI003D0D3870